MRIARIAVTVTAVWLQGWEVAAQTSVAVVPSVSIGGVYDDNLLFGGVEGTEGQMMQVRPSFEASVESPRTTFLGLYSFDAIRSNHPALTTLDARRHALVDARIRTTPVTTIGFAARYDRTETPGEINIESGFLSARVQAHRTQATPSFVHRVSPRLTVNGSYDLIAEDLDDAGRGTQQSVRTGFARERSPRTTFSIGYLGRHFADAAGTQNSHTLLAGWTRKWSHAVETIVQAGPRVSSYRGTDLELAATLARTTNRLGVGLDYWRGEAMVLGIHGPVAISGATARVSWPFLRTGEFSVRTGLSDITTIDRRNATVYRGAMVASWTPRAPITLSGSYGADYQVGDVRRVVFADRRVLRHVVTVTMTIAPRLTHSMLPPDEAARAKGVSR